MQSSVVLDTGMSVSALYGSREISRLAALTQVNRPALGRRGAEANDARTGEVRLRHSSDEVGEQVCASRRGVGGAKACGQGEREPIEQAPNAESGAFVPTIGSVYEREQKSHKTERFTSLLHYVTPEVLALAFSWLKRDAASGIDGVTWKEYETNQEEKLADLHQRLHRGGFRTLPSKRKYIPKADGRLRPLGIAALEDKIVQRAVVEVLNAIYEQDFLGFSYGCRPGAWST